MANTRNYNKEKIHAMIVFLLLAVIYYYLAFLEIKDGHSGVGDAMVMTPILCFAYIEYVALRTKAELFKKLQIEEEKGKAAVITRNLIFIAIMGIAVIAYVWHLRDIIMSAIK